MTSIFGQNNAISYFFIMYHSFLNNIKAYNWKMPYITFPNKEMRLPVDHLKKNSEV